MTSLQIRSGRRGSRSTQAPAKKPTSRTARLADTTRIAISVGPAPSTSRATSGTAVRVTTDPSADTVWPAQSFMNSVWCHSDGVVMRAGGYCPAPPALRRPGVGGGRSTGPASALDGRGLVGRVAREVFGAEQFGDLPPVRPFRRPHHLVGLRLPSGLP